MTSRKLVYDTLEFRNPSRVPRQMWTLPWAERAYPREMQALRERFPDDIGGVAPVLRQQPRTEGDMYAPGQYTDEWGCVFTNIYAGIIGEVKHPQIPAEDTQWETADKVCVPEELLSFEISEVNAACAQSEKFLLCGACPRPFEQLQFIRGTENLYMDLMDPPAGMLAFLRRMHTFYCDLLEKWAKTDVDALNFMDDWGAQRSLLIPPEMWKQYFLPLYRDYIDIAHRHGKKAFMHSDGYILDILPDLIDAGLDAVNSQLFCMGLEQLRPFRGKITFWGEIDRQNLLPRGTVDEVRAAVRQVYDALWCQGGCIAQLEFGPGAKPENVEAVYETWNTLPIL